MFGRKTPFYCHNMYLTAAILVSLSLVYMVMVSLLLWLRRWLLCFFLLFTVLAFTFYPLLLFLYFLFRWLSDMDSVLGIRVGGVLLFFTMLCNNPITPKRFYFFFYYFFYFLPLDSDSYFLLPCSPILYFYSLPGQWPSLYVCLRSQTVSKCFFSNVWSGQGLVLHSILDSLFSALRQVLVIPISFRGQWSSIASIPFLPFLGFGSGGWLLSICACTSYSIPRL